MRMFNFYRIKLRDRFEVVSEYSSAIGVLSVVSSLVFIGIILLGFYISVAILTLVSRLFDNSPTIMNIASLALLAGGAAAVTLATIWFCLLFINLKNHDYQAHSRGLLPAIELEDEEDEDE